MGLLNLENFYTGFVFLACLILFVQLKYDYLNMYLLILLMTSFYPRKKYIGDSTTMIDILFKKVKQYINIINKASEQFTIIEYALIIIFVISGRMKIDYISIKMYQDVDLKHLSIMRKFLILQNTC